MTVNLRRHHREYGHVPITVVARDGLEDTILSQIFHGHMINISSHGACILMTRVIQETYHVFHTTREKDSAVLQLTITVPPDTLLFSIAARPVWFDLFRKESSQTYKMGVEFTSAPDQKQMKELLHAMRTTQDPKGRSTWFSNIIPWKRPG